MTDASPFIDNLERTRLSRAPRQRSTGDRRQRARNIVIGLGFILVLMSFASLGIGATEIGLGTALKATRSIFDGSTLKEALSAREYVILLDIRLPRVVLGILVGAALAVSGAVMQGMFRNPLADPGLVGVSAGAALAVVSMIVLGGTYLAFFQDFAGILALPTAAFFGAVLSTSALYTIATRRGRTSVATMLLAGIAMGALAGAATGFLIFHSTEQQLRDLTFWGLGSLGGSTWLKVYTAGPFIVAALLVSPFIARGLNALVLGEAEALHLGIPVQTLKRAAVLTVAAATGAAVAVSGTIGFVGIVVPHLLRLAIGPDNQYLLPASALLGASLLLAADAIARTIVAPAELPIGIVTAAIGAPFFLWILLRRRSLLDL
ncbi:MAG: iron ABC transporter permease [Rhizobiales bacterium]|nr:iron ABC transporter permease [Hyphomicrobiales bacterium]